MRPPKPCSGCSRCAVGFGAELFRNEVWRCLERSCEVDREDGCTMGDENGQTFGVVAYNVDSNRTNTYVINW